MTWGEIDDAGTAYNFGEDKDEGDGGQYQRLRPRTRIPQSLGNNNGDKEVERRRQNFCSKGI